MDRKSAEQLIYLLYEHALGRLPAAEEGEKWVQTVIAGMTPEAVVRAFFLSDEYRTRNRVRSIFPCGHYHSPVVDPETVKEYVDNERNTPPEKLYGINLDINSMRARWLAHLPFIQTTPFTDQPNDLYRYNYLGGPYPWGDAITLRMMINHYRPTKIIEIGSGYSSACMLDTVDEIGLEECKLICIEPYPDRLHSLLRPEDHGRVQIVNKPIQEVDPAIVDILQPNDILFIDSTHVLKTGSDVHFELFHLLPRLKKGVVVHFHDIGYPFEYPNEWIYDDNYSWNETYALRAFLMFNSDFHIVFWNSLYVKFFGNDINKEFPTFLRNPGGSIWLARS